MTTKTTVAETYLTVFYRFQFPDGSRFVVASTPLTPDVAGNVIGNVTQDYSLITPIIPPGRAWPFLRASNPTPEYVEANTGLRGSLAQLLSALCPLLVAVRPIDDLEAAADGWYASL
jgi:hypothetical protein